MPVYNVSIRASGVAWFQVKADNEDQAYEMCRSHDLETRVMLPLIDDHTLPSDIAFVTIDDDETDMSVEGVADDVEQKLR